MSTASATAPRPVPFQGDLRNLPAGLAPLKQMPNWVCWRWEWKVNKKGVGKWDKPPFRPDRPHGYAKNNDPSTWGTYEQALAAFDAGECDGIGFNLSGTNVAAFDLDKCRDPESGQIVPEAMQIVDAASSYTEMTVSGTGLRVIGFGSGPKMHRKQKLGGGAEVESYRGAERYIVVTGNPLPETWPNITDIDAHIDDVVSKLDGAPQPDNVFDFNSAKRQQDEPRSNDQLLPRELVELIHKGVTPHEDLSGAFHHAVCWLGDCGWSATRIEAYIAGKPIVPERFAKRLSGEIARCLHKAKPRDEAPRSEQQAGAETRAPIELLWHGKNQDRKPRSWLVKDLIPETGKGLASGQWGSAKTFGMIDLAGAVVTGTPFAGREVARRGGILFVAAEGASEVPIRLQGIVDHKLRPHSLAAGAAGEPLNVDLGNLPFAWIEECPSLKEDFQRLLDAAKSAARHIKEQFDLPLALIIIDTLNAAANFKDGNDAAEGQFIMNRLEELSRSTGAFALAVDHFGKAVETGTRGTTAKEAAADAVLAFLADRDTSGNVKNLRLAVRKLRGGATGAETPYDLKAVDIGNGDTTCVIDWREGESVKPAQRADRWSKGLRVFKAAMATSLADTGAELRPFGADGPAVRGVTEHAVRQEFKSRYPGEASAKLKAFKRSLNEALAKELIGSREVGGVDHLWFVKDKDEKTDN
jgi:hypothetical protein